MTLTVEKPAEANSPAPVRVMVVDDSIVARGFYKRWLDSEPDLEFAASFRGGREAVDNVERINPDIVVLDIEMPVMDGLELTRRIRASKSFPHLAVVAVTSLSGEDSAKRGRDAGVDGYLVKLDREKILGTVESFLQKRNAKP